MAELPEGVPTPDSLSEESDNGYTKVLEIDMDYVPHDDEGNPQPLDRATGDCGVSFLYVSAVPENDEVHIDYGFEINRSAYGYNGFWALENEDTGYSDSGGHSGFLFFENSWETQFNEYSERGEVTVNAYLIAYTPLGNCYGTRVLEERVLVL